MVLLLVASCRVASWWTTIRDAINIVSNDWHSSFSVMGFLLLRDTLVDAHVHVALMSNRRRTISMNRVSFRRFIVTIKVHLRFQFVNQAFDLK